MWLCYGLNVSVHTKLIFWVPVSISTILRGKTFGAFFSLNLESASSLQSPSFSVGCDMSNHSTDGMDRKGLHSWTLSLTLMIDSVGRPGMQVSLKTQMRLIEI